MYKILKTNLVDFWWIDGLKSWRCVGHDVEVRGGWGAHGSGPVVHIHLIVNQAPLLQESVDSVYTQNTKHSCYNIKLLYKTYEKKKNQ